MERSAIRTGGGALHTPQRRLRPPATPRRGSAREGSRASIIRTLSLLLFAWAPTLHAQARPHDVLILGARVLDGAGNPWVRQDVAVRADRISFVGHASSRGVRARDTVRADGLYLSPGFIDAHSHAELDADHGRDGLAFLYQGITTAIIGVDGGGTNAVARAFAEYQRKGIGVNAAVFVGHGAARQRVMGPVDRPPNPDEMARMQAYVRQGMREGALGLSTGLFYAPGTYARTDEVIALNRVAAEFGGVYDTHDRDLGAVYGGIGFEASMREAIEIGEKGGTPVIFSHLSPQGIHNYGRASVAIRLIDEARARGVNVMAAHHPYTATQSNLRSYTVPDWAFVGGHARMLERFRDSSVVARIDDESTKMIAFRGGPQKILIVDARPDLNGKTVDDMASRLGLTPAAAVRKILEGGNAAVMNLDLYDIENIRLLAGQEWMMTCTDGRSPPPGVEVTHPRPYGAFTRKLRMFVREESIVSLPFAIRGMTSLAASFLGLGERGLVREGFYADLALFDLDQLDDPATIEQPRRYARGMRHVLVNGRFAIRDGKTTGVLAGRGIRRGGA
jgi:N-acyl-D-amino-acid deacylase